MTPRRHNLAFTLLEMLAASALASLLMLALLAVVRSLAVTRLPDDPRPSSASLVRAIRQDLLGAASIRRDAGRLVLAGHSGLDRKTLLPANQPAIVEYRVIAVGEKNWLVRIQRDLGLGADAVAWSELLCAGVREIDVQPADPPPPPDPNANPNTPPLLPTRLRLRVQWDNPARPVLDEVIVTR